MQNTIINNTHTLSKWMLWAMGIILILPIIILPPSFQPSDWDRAIFLRLILAVLGGYLLYRFFYRRDLAMEIPKKDWSFYLPILAMAGFLAVSIISTFVSQDPRFSIFGSPTRAGGVLNLLIFFLFTLLATFFIKGNLWEKLIKISFGVGVLAGLLALVQYAGLLKTFFIGWEEGGPPSFMGSSTVLAIYMIFLVFSCFNFLLEEPDKARKAWYAGLLAFFLLTIVITGSRATYLGIFIAFAFYFLTYPKAFAQAQDRLIAFINPGRLRIFKIAALISIAVMAVGLIYVNFTPSLPSFIENNKQLSYLIHDRLSFNLVARDLVGTRLSVWKITWQAISEKPWLGWGPENFYIGFEKYFDPTYPPSLQKLWWDRPHNAFLEIWTNSGVFALVAYLAFWVVLMWGLQRLKNKQYNSKTSHLAHGLQAMFIAYLVVLFFNFDNVSTYLISSFFVAYSLYLIALPLEKRLAQVPTMPAGLKKPAAAIFILAGLVLVWFLGLQPFYLNEKMVLASNLAAARQCDGALDVENNSNWANAGIIKNYALLKYSDIIKSCTYARPDKEAEYAKKALDSLTIATKEQPAFSRTWLFMGGFANVLAAREPDPQKKNSWLIQARSYLAQGIKLSPKRQEMLIELEKNYLVGEDYQHMEATAKECVSIDPSLGECYWYLGISQIFLGNQTEGAKNISLSKEHGYNDPPYKELAVAYMSQKNWAESVKAYERIDIPTDRTLAASHHATLAFLYRQAGDYTRASQEAIKVYQADPTNPEAVQFIEGLLGLSPNNPALHTSLAYIYVQTGQKEKAQQEILIARTIYLRLIQTDPNNWDYHWSLANISYSLQEYDRGYQQALTTLRLRPDLQKQVEDLLSRFPQSYWSDYNDRKSRGTL